MIPEPADSAFVTPASFHEPTRRLVYFRAWLGWWVSNRRSMIRVDRRGLGRTVYPGDNIGSCYGKALAAPVVHIHDVTARRWAVSVALKRIPAADIRLVRHLYGDVTWRMTEEVLFAFVDRTMVAGIVCFGPQDRGPRI